MTPISVTTNPDAATLNNNVGELEKLNGDIGEVNCDGAFELTKDKIRAGSATRSTTRAAVAWQKFDRNEAAPGFDLVTDEEYTLAGTCADILLPPGRWSLVIRFGQGPRAFATGEAYEELVWRVRGSGVETALNWTGGTVTGPFRVDVPFASYSRVIDVYVRYRMDAGDASADHGAEFTPVSVYEEPAVFFGPHINVTAFRTP